MIKIKIEAADGQDLRVQLLQLLGFDDNYIQNCGTELKTIQARDVAKAPSEVEEPIKNTDSVDVSVEKSEPAKRKRRTKAEIEAEKVQEAQEAQEDSQQTDEPGDDKQTIDESRTIAGTGSDGAQKEVNLDELRTFIMTRSGEGHREAIWDILHSYGVEKIGQLTDDQRNDMYQKVAAI